MGEKGNLEMMDELRAMATQQEPGLRERVMQLLSDYETVRDVTPDRRVDEPEAPGSPGARGPSDPPV